MTNQQILEKAIKKAIDNGWASTDDNASQQWLGKLKSDQKGIDNAGGEDQLFFKEEWYPVIFNHDFAKALWGTELANGKMGLKAFGRYRPKWQTNLMRMVIAKDPIKYLGDNI